MPSSQVLTLAQKAVTLGLFTLTCSGAYVVGGAGYKILDKRVINPQNYSIVEGSGTDNGLPGPGPAAK